MDEFTKRLKEEAERLTKFTDAADLSKTLGLGAGSAMEELRKQLTTLDSLKGLEAFETRLPELTMPTPYRMPDIPTFEDTNRFQSAGVLLKRLAGSITQWRAALPDNVQPAIIAILHGGIQINVDLLAQESFHGIRIEGRLNDAPAVVLAHQATVQLLCFVQPVQPPEHPRRQIGFVINGEKSEA